MRERRFLSAPGLLEIPLTHLENDIIDALLVQKCQLVQTLSLRWVDLIGELCRSGQPLNAVALALGEADFAVQLGETEAVHRTDVRQDRGATTLARWGQRSGFPLPRRGAGGDFGLTGRMTQPCSSPFWFPNRSPGTALPGRSRPRGHVCRRRGRAGTPCRSRACPVGRRGILGQR